MSAWLDQVFFVVNGKARMARRKARDVQKQSSEAELLTEAKTRGFHVARIGPQYRVFRDPIDVKG